MSFVFRQEDTEYYLQKDGKLTTVLPGGIYKVKMDMTQIWFSQIKPVTDTLINIPGSVHESVVKDIETFLSPETRTSYKEYGVVHKRGILLHGPAGTGKTVTAIKVAKSLIDRGGVILFNPEPTLLATVVPIIRQNNPDTTIGIIYEEFDSYLHGGAVSTILSVLDGELQVDNMVVIACTNYMSRIPERIKNRPSRFASVLEVGAPDADFRKSFFEQKLLKKDQDKVMAFVDATEGFVVDQMKDLIVSTMCLGMTLPDAVNKLKDMQASGQGVEDYYERQASDALEKESQTSLVKFIPKPLR